MAIPVNLPPVSSSRTRRVQALWGEPCTARSVFVDGNEVVPFSRRCQRSLATCQAMRGDAVKARPVERRRKWWPPRALNRPFRRWGFDSSHWLFSQCFRASSPNNTERSQSINGHQSRKRNFGHQSSISCAWEKGKESWNACRKNPDRVCLKAQLNTRCSGWRNKKQGRNRALAQASFREKSLSFKAKGRQCRSTGFARDFGLANLDHRRGHKAKRSEARSIGCFLSAFVHLLRTLPKEVSRSTATNVESGISDPNRRSLVRERRVKKDRMLVEKIQIEFVSKGSWILDAVGEETKTRVLAQASFREKTIVIQSQRKAMSKYGICAGFWFGSSWAQSQTVRRSIYT